MNNNWPRQTGGDLFDMALDDTRICDKIRNIEDVKILGMQLVMMHILIIHSK